MIRTCLHCALARAMGAEAAALDAARLRVRVSHAEPVWLPVSGAQLYRALRGLLREVTRTATDGTVHVAVLDASGKSHVEVTATVPTKHRARVLSRSFARCALDTLPGGFAEGGS